MSANFYGYFFIAILCNFRIIVNALKTQNGLCARIEAFITQWNSVEINELINNPCIRNWKNNKCPSIPHHRILPPKKPRSVEWANKSRKYTKSLNGTNLQFSHSFVLTFCSFSHSVAHSLSSLFANIRHKTPSNSTLNRIGTVEFTYSIICHRSFRYWQYPRVIYVVIISIKLYTLFTCTAITSTQRSTLGLEYIWSLDALVFCANIGLLLKI